MSLSLFYHSHFQPLSSSLILYFTHFKRLRNQLVKLSQQLLPRWELGREEIPVSPLPKEGFLSHCRQVGSEGCGVYLECC